MSFRSSGMGSSSSSGSSGSAGFGGNLVFAAPLCNHLLLVSEAQILDQHGQLPGFDGAPRWGTVVLLEKPPQDRLQKLIALQQRLVPLGALNLGVEPLHGELPGGLCIELLLLHHLVDLLALLVEVRLLIAVVNVARESNYR